MSTLATDDLAVQDVMVSDVRTIMPEAPAARAVRIMTDLSIRHLVVIDGVREVVGVISQRNVLAHFSPWLTKLKAPDSGRGTVPRCEVREIMVSPAITVTAHTPIRAAAAILAANKIGCLPVVDGDNRLVGLLSSVDLLEFVGRNHLPEPEEEFHVFMPPAFLSKDDEFVIPLGYFPELEEREEALAVLAYARQSKRIGVKVFRRGQEGEQLQGARPATITDKYVSIPARDFLDHHSLNIRGPLEVSQNKQTGYFILTPVLEP